MSDDLLDDFLQPPIHEALAGVKAALRDRTARVVRWRRYRRRVLQVVVVATAQGAIAAAVVAWLVAAAGALTWTEQTPLPPDAPFAQNQEKPRDDPASPPESEQALSAVALEWTAFDASPEDQAALYFQAAQRYFDDHQDFASALRCYRQAFDAGPKDFLTVSPSDNWLVMAIKLDCQKEN